MLDYLPIVWVAIIAVSVACEAAMHTFITLWFAPAAAASLVLSFAGVPEWLEVLVFFLTALVLLVISRTVFAFRSRTKKRLAAGGGAVVGRQALVIETVDNLRMCGKVSIDGVERTAVSHSDDCVIPAGEVVTVIGEKNGALICK